MDSRHLWNPDYQSAYYFSLHIITILTFVHILVIQHIWSWSYQQSTYIKYPIVLKIKKCYLYYHRNQLINIQWLSMVCKDFCILKQNDHTDVDIIFTYKFISYSILLTINTNQCVYGYINETICLVYFSALSFLLSI